MTDILCRPKAGQVFLTDVLRQPATGLNRLGPQAAFAMERREVMPASTRLRKRRFRSSEWAKVVNPTVQKAL